MDVPEPAGRAQLQQAFHESFARTEDSLQTRIDGLAQAGGERAAAIDACLAGLAQLSDAVKGAGVYLAPYDLRLYSERIKTLATRLDETRAAVAPKAKFSFKTGRRKVTEEKSTGESKLDRERDVLETVTTPEAVGEGAAVRGLRAQHVLLAPSTALATRSGLVEGLQRCVVDLAAREQDAPAWANLVLRDVEHSLLLCGRVDGSVHLSGMRDTVIVVTCHQFRMHASTNCRVLLHCASNPIIEACQGISFAPLPQRLADAGMASPDHNKWDQVDDFKWLKAEHSPNWHVLADADAVADDVWSQVLSGKVPSVAVLLEAAGAC